jgi:RNA polymerase sigma-32 factor
VKYIMDSWSLVKVGTTQGAAEAFLQLKPRKTEARSRWHLSRTENSRKLLPTYKEEDLSNMELRLSHTGVSLNIPLHVGEIESPGEKSAILSRTVREFKDALDDRASFIFYHRIIADDPMTRRALGERFGISRERVRGWREGS